MLIVQMTTWRDTRVENLPEVITPESWKDRAGKGPRRVQA